MDKSKIIKYSLVHSLAVVAYVFLAATLMFNAEKWFGKMNGVAGVSGFLLLFVLSAAVVGALVVGKPLAWYLDGQKKEALSLFLKTVLWIVLWLLVVFAITAIV